MWPGLISMPLAASLVGRPLARSICWASTAVNVAGMCWAITIGQETFGESAPRSVSSACGPPVELPMAMMRGGRIVGLVHYIFHRSTTLDGPICYLQDLFTVETERGTGVGRALIEGVYAAAKAANSARVYWHTHETNHTAMRLYDGVADKPGFVMYRKDV